MTAAYTLENRIVHWHHDRNLIHGSTDHQQFEKLLEEVEEAYPLTSSNPQSITSALNVHG